MSDQPSWIVLTGLRVRGFHGVLPAERAEGQDFVIDVHLDVDTTPAAASDDLADTVDYGVLATRLAEIIEGEPVDLIETLAERLADACLADPRVRSVDLTVHKPFAPIPRTFDDVAVRIVRSR